MALVFIPYFLLKMVLFFGIVKSLVQFDTLQKYQIFLALLYTAGVALLSYVFIFGWQSVHWFEWQVALANKIGVSPWVSWVGQTFLLSSIYFWLIVRFEETSFFWVLLIFGIAVVAY